MKGDSPPQFESFIYQGVAIHPPTAYTTGRAHRSHLRRAAHELGELYRRFYKEFPNYFRYMLWNVKDRLFPSTYLAQAILAGLQHFNKHGKL